MFFVEGWWNHALMEQMVKRIHRKGQSEECNVYHYVLLGTIEERMLSIQDR